MTATEPSYISISELTRALGACLDQGFPQILFTGEISEITRAASGHLYLTIKDPKSQVSVVMWRAHVVSLGFEPKPGSIVRCHGRPNIYPVTGRLQIVVHQMLPDGEGLLQKKFLELKAKLEREGIFVPERKRPIPFLPRAIGIVTSKSGAVIHDIMVKLRERMPIVPVFLVDVRVQGEGAAGEIAAAIEFLNQRSDIEVIIVARGGGSLEDLWAFNEERTVRAIFASRIPVVSGVGHEVDVTLSDMVADVRAPTPTAAAELVVPHRRDLLGRIDQLSRRLGQYERWFMPLVQRVDEVTLRLDSSLQQVLRNARLHLQAAEARLKLLQPEQVLRLFAARVSLFEQRLAMVLSSLMRDQANRLQRLSDKLELLSPRRIMQRGYSVVRRGGKLITSARTLAPAERLELLFHEGRAEAIVESSGD